MKTKAKPIPYTQDELLELFRYEPETGKLYWRVDMGTRARAGDEAGCVRNRDGHRTVKIKKRAYKAHRLIWVIWYGGIREDMEIDHKDRVRDNNRIGNLRLVTEQQNHWNLRECKGYYWAKQERKWRAKIIANKRYISLGYHDTEQEARAAYLKAKRKHHQIGRISSEVDRGVVFGGQRSIAASISTERAETALEPFLISNLE